MTGLPADELEMMLALLVAISSFLVSSLQDQQLANLQLVTLAMGQMAKIQDLEESQGTLLLALGITQPHDKRDMSGNVD